MQAYERKGEMSQGMCVRRVVLCSVLLSISLLLLHGSLAAYADCVPSFPTSLFHLIKDADALGNRGRPPSRSPLSYIQQEVPTRTA